MGKRWRLNVMSVEYGVRISSSLCYMLTCHICRCFALKITRYGASKVKSFLQRCRHNGHQTEAHYIVNIIWWLLRITYYIVGIADNFPKT
jgi:rRNA maturation endonuclease Nob1